MHGPSASLRGGVLALILVGFASLPASPAPRPQAPPKALIYAGWYGNTIPTPSFVASHFDFLESQPFNGLVLYLRNASMTVNVSFNVTNASPISYASMMSVLDPVKDLAFTQLTDNFAYVLCNDPPDYFDDWSVPVQNFANLARALKDSGLKGVFLDNEQYVTPCFAYPDGVSYPQYSLGQYSDQARLRGRQVMEAMVAEFPDIAVVTLHGPYISEPEAPWQLLFPAVVPDNALMGPFFAGFHEGRGAQTLNVDGGELYWLRSSSEFAASYDWRRYDLASEQVDCAFIDGALRSSWSQTISIGFGVYDGDLDPAELASTLSNAVANADRYVWFYAESMTYLLPESQGGAPQVWVEAVREALPEGSSPTPPPPPPPAPTLQISPGGDDVRKSSCGLLGIEVIPAMLLIAWVRVRRRR